MATRHLSQTQIKVIGMLVKGGVAQKLARMGSTLIIDRRKASRDQTFESLEKKGYVKKLPNDAYEITPSGKEMGKKLGFH